MERVRIFPLKGISRRQETIIREGQMEAARVWNLCLGMHLAARRENLPWPGKRQFHEATKGGRFALHSQSIQHVFRAFDAAVQSARENRKAGRKEIRYPYKDKRFFPLMWPAQAMGLEEKRIVLLMGRGRPALDLARPQWLTGKAACKVVWNGVHHKLHIRVEVENTAPTASQGATQKRATVDLGQIHQAAVVTNEGGCSGRLWARHSIPQAPAQQATGRNPGKAIPLSKGLAKLS
ncbi:MAG: hypothetical protein QXQ66_09425 [Candidatus Hadarchaeum sp.]|uniref:hypothetical protein n=1 Tax=Candidatus Hadarchaeum sp. TaxID=2883567 RepID=UPI00316DB1F9